MAYVHSVFSTRTLILIASFAGLIFPLLSMAHGDGGIEIKDAWVREAPPNARVLAAYMDIENHTSTQKSLTSATSAAFGNVEIHQTIEKDGVASMEKVEKIDIPAQGKVTLGPGGLHMMLIDPKQVLKAGDKVNLTLMFTDGSKSIIDASVKKLSGGDHDHMHMHNDHAQHDAMDTKKQHHDMDHEHHHSD